MDHKIYIRFDAPKPEKSLPSNGPLKKVVKNTFTKILTMLIPKANPDFEHLLNQVDFWKIEFDKIENLIWREIGFDKDGVSIVAMPLGKNYGYWVDNHLTLDDYRHFDSTNISVEEFKITKFTNVRYWP